MIQRWLLLLCCAIAPPFGSTAADEPAPLADSFAAAAEPFSADEAVRLVKTYCVDCHHSADPQAHLDLEHFSSAEEVAQAIERWNKIAQRVRDGQMPPVDYEAPDAARRAAFVDWIRQTIHRAVCDQGAQPGPPRVRRLNRHEHANTLRDLLNIRVNTSHGLPEEGAGGEGFDNASEVLFVSPIHAERYLEAGRAALDYALKDAPSRQSIIITQPAEDRTPAEAAQAVLSSFLKRAFRRPVEAEELQDYLSLFERVFAEEADFILAIEQTLEAVLISPKFLFLWEEPARAGHLEPVTQFELASRLSYFLWASMPDDRLLELAEQGRLHDEQVLREQVARMLHSKIDDQGLRRDAKVREFASSFVEQWLGTRALGREFQPDESVIKRFDAELVGGMKYEPIFFFEELLSENRSLLELIDADFSYLNRRLASHYRIRGEFREQPKRVELPPDSHRGGVLTMGAVLAVSSLPHRTSPVLRGKWILETLLGTPPPPPPPDVQELDESSAENLPRTLRERLELHRADPVCTSCHSMMDPLGFGLENFDAVGRWREEIDGQAVDAHGELPGGVQFEGPGELKQLLLERRDQLARNLTTKMMGYALSRQLSNEDHCVVEEIVAKLAENEYRMHTLVFEIVNSVPFRYKRGDAE